MRIVQDQARSRAYGRIIWMGAVVANAVHDAVGARVYRMPLTPKRVLASIRG